MFLWVKKLVKGEARRSSRLLKLLNSTSPLVAKQAAQELEAILWPRHPGNPRVIPWEQWNSIQEEHFQRIRKSEAIIPLLNALRSGTPFARCFLLANLDAIGEQRALPALWDALWDPEPSVRSTAAHSSLISQKPESIPRLIELLRDVDSDVVHSASSSLGRIRAAAAVDPLAELFNNRDWRRRQSALWALGNILDSRILPLLRSALQDKHRAVRKAAKSALASFDNARRKKLKQIPWTS